MGSCWEKQRCIIPAERNHVGIDAVEKDIILLILKFISITQVTGGELFAAYVKHCKKCEECLL